MPSVLPRAMVRVRGELGMTEDIGMQVDHPHYRLHLPKVFILSSIPVIYSRSCRKSWKPVFSPLLGVPTFSGKNLLSHGCQAAASPISRRLLAPKMLSHSECQKEPPHCVFPEAVATLPVNESYLASSKIQLLWRTCRYRSAVFCSKCSNLRFEAYWNTLYPVSSGRMPAGGGL